jgi:hypothetical protein
VSRGVVATVLVILGCVLAGPAVAAYALDRQITDQDRYLAAVAPLADDPAVRREVAEQLSGAIDERLDQLPDSARRIVDSAVARVVDSEAFSRAWISINRVAHPRLIAMLRGDPGSLRVEADTVLLDVGAVAAEVKARLIAEGVPFAERLPEITASVPLFSRPAVRRAIPAFGTWQALRIALPVAVVAVLVAALIVGPRRDRTLILAGGGIVVVMLLIVLYQWIARGQLVARSRSPDLAGAYYDALTGSLATLRWVVLGVGAAAALAGVLFRLRGRRYGSGMKKRPRPTRT